MNSGHVVAFALGAGSVLLYQRYAKKGRKG